jgi:transposase
MRTVATAEELQQENQRLQEENARLKAQERRYRALSEQLSEEVRLLRDKLFGRKADSVEIAKALCFVFDEAEAIQEVSQEQELSIASHTRKKRGRKPLPAELPRIEKIIDIPEEMKVCACGTQRVVIGNETREKLIHIPAVMYVERQVRLTYACHTCEGSGDEDLPAVITAETPPAIIPKGIASGSLLSTIITNKFIDHLPYYRQEMRFRREGINICRQDMSNWQLKSYEMLNPLMRLLDHAVYSGEVLHMDETTVQVLQEKDRRATQKSYMWLMRGGPPVQPVVRYRYFPTRSASHASQLLTPFSGYLMTDGYAGYDSALTGRDDVVQVNCWAHARRKFSDAAKASKKTQSASEGLKFIRKLYTIESELREALAAGRMSEAEFVEQRKTDSEEVLTKFKTWLENKQRSLVPSSLLGKAVDYTLSRWEKLVRYLDHPHLTPDNNASERKIKPFVTGRKNWLFSGSEQGATSSAGYYSLIETAKENGLNPQVYLFYLFEKAPYCNSTEDWDKLLPWNVELPDTLDIGFISKLTGLSFS